MRTAHRPSIVAGHNFATAYRRNNYIYPAMNATSQTQVLPSGTAHFCWFPVHTPVRLDRLGVNQTLPGDAGSTVRLGVYRNNASGNPSSLVLDAGFVIATGANGGLDVNMLPFDLDTGNYWLAVCAQGGTGVAQFTAITQSSLPNLGAVAINGLNYIGYTSTGFPVSGPLPATAVGAVRTNIVIAVHPHIA